MSYEKRKIIQIDESKCDGCGICADACHEKAIAVVNGKAKLTRDDYCDGLGDCLPACPRNAITFTVREGAPYDHAAVMANMEKVSPRAKSSANTPFTRNFPVQIQLVPANAPYFKNADLLIAADCTAYTHESFRKTFMRGKITLIGCPKLDDCDYSEKLSEILTANEITSVTVARMEVPCCGGIEHAVKTAIARSGKDVPLRVVTVGIDGSVEEDA